MSILTITVLLCAVGLAVLCGQSLFQHKNFKYFCFGYLVVFSFIGLVALQIPVTTVVGVFAAIVLVGALGWIEEYAKSKKHGS